MGLVYLARSPGGRLVAVKVIHTHLTDDPRFLQRFRSEVRAARAVSGFYTAPVIDADTDSRPAWLATAHVPGPDLATVVKTRGPLPGPSVTALAAALAEALKAVHASGVVHRDLKPSNILLAQDGPRVIDFGIVHALDGPATFGGLVGTPGYMSPEQARGGEIEPANDVFALGSVLYFASTGRPPFGTGDLPVILHRVVHEEPDLAMVPRAQRDLVARCMAKRPSERPSPDQILDALAASIAAADHVDWAELYGTVIDAYATETAAYTRGEPEPDPEPESGPEPEPEPEPVPRQTTQLEPEETVQPGPVREPEP
ncbi:serine/threonine-protein kinase, partial [Actinomadura sp. 7K507]|uniref:serine/threonine-protein kinase n=1 Tax=Actinomadura sp. 7K507 TaxID=2530365 RepID=UPI00104CBCBF